ncbi:MAG: FAD-dependent monooxygenase [Rhodospirillales bacterium]
MRRAGALRIAVVGGGLGGTVAAIMLHRAGHDVALYEQAPEIARIGAGINLSPNVTRVIRALGLEGPLTTTGLLPDRFDQRDWDTGRFTYVLRYDQFPERYGAPHVILHRGDLQQVLNSALAPGVLRLGKRLADLDETAGGMRLSFADGTTADADIVIGADGINSRVREILIGEEQPVYTGHVAHRAIYPASLLNGLRVADASKWWAEDRYFMAYYLTPKRDEMYLVTGVPMDWPSDEFSPAPISVDQFRDAFAGFHPEVQTLIAACPSVLAWPVLYRAPYPLWSRGRIVLLGDACHPMKPHMGQGAAMAMEDAAMLARCIEHGRGDDPAKAFALYESLRFDRTTRVKVTSDGHEWMRHGSDGDWLYGYDVFAVPLEPPQPAAAPALASA